MQLVHEETSFVVAFMINNISSEELSLGYAWLLNLGFCILCANFKYSKMIPSRSYESPHPAIVHLKLNSAVFALSSSSLTPTNNPPTP